MNAQTGLPPLDAGREGPLSPVAPLPELPTASWGLVGRDVELRALRDFLREATAHGATRVLSGHAGSGKSALLKAAVELATAAGVRVLHCTGIRGSNPSDLAGLLQIVWPVLESPAWSLAAGRLEALETLLVDGAPARGGRAQLSFAVLDALESASTHQPLLIAVDDWDALDEPSKDALSFLGRRTEGHSLALLMTSRLHRMPSLAGLQELRLGPLTPAQSAHLLATRRPGLDAHAVRELMATAAGNPLALLELPARTEDLLPYAPASSDRLAAAMAPGAARLPSGTRDLLLVAALHPQGDLPLLLSAASRIGDTELGSAVLEPAEREGLAVFDGMRLLFNHPATAGAVVHDVGPRRCRAAHEALAAVLAQGSVRMLWHLSQAVEGCDPELAGRLEAVHRQALEQGEPQMAVRLLRRAADLYQRPEDRGRCSLRAAQLAHALGLDRMARTTAHRALRHPLGPLGTLCAEALTRNPNGMGYPVADPATWPAPIGTDEQENALELAQLTAPAVADDDERAPALLAFLDGLPEHVRDPRLLHAMATAGPVRRAATVITGVSAFRQLADVPVHDLERLGEAALLAGDPLRALDLYRQAERRHRFHDLSDQLPRVLLRQGLAHLALGDWGQSDHAFRNCVELADEHGQSRHAAAAGLLGELVRGLRTGAAVRAADACGLVAARHSEHAIDAILAVGTACAQAEGGDFAAAFATLSILLADPRGRAAALYALVPFAEAAEAENAADEALAMLDRLEEDLGAECAPTAAARLAAARAVLADDQDAEAMLERAFAHDLSRQPFLEAALRLAHGRRLRRRRRFADSRATLSQAAATFTMMGAEARAMRIAAELRASGERAEAGAANPLRPASARDLLTAQELRIARLAGRGLSNREIGELLDLSPRTIGAYLYRIFPRLGVTARAQLAAVLTDRHAA
ncbi:AAA family ATPase [Streptomyces sp. NPDC097727]|uniref:helix-turn-helix transcriptional regulator n=1 Tax=Streptomyces sp. NPDC097727 TaxID=3366092 RepID=UPI0037F9B440